MEARQENHTQKSKLVKVQILGPYGVINQYIEKNKFTIGKKGYADIGLDFKFIEDIHIQVEVRANKRIFITDLATSRGTFLSRRKLGPTTPTKYISGCEIGFAGMSQAIVLSLITEGDNDHSKALLKLVDAQKIYDESTQNANILFEENNNQIKNLKQTAFDEIKFDKNQMQEELENLKQSAIENIKLQTENENKKFEKLLKKNTRQIFKYENKVKKLEQLTLDLKKIKNELESENQFNSSELEKRKVLLIEADKEITYLKDNFEKNKKNILKTIEQFSVNSDSESQKFKLLKNEIDGQLVTLDEKKDNLKNQIAKKQNTLKTKSKEIKELEESIRKKNKEFDKSQRKVEYSQKKIASLETSSTGIISSAKEKSLKLISEAQTHANQVMKSTHKETSDILEKACELSKEQSEQVINIAKESADNRISSSVNESNLIKEQARKNYELLEAKSLAIKEEIITIETKKKQLTNEYKETQTLFEKEIEEKQLKEMERTKEEFDQMQKRRGQMTYKFEQEKKTFQDRLDKLGLDYSKNLNQNIPDFPRTNEPQSSDSTLPPSIINKKKKYYLRLLAPSLLSFTLALVLSYFYMSPNTNKRDLASTQSFSYLDYDIEVNKKIGPKIIKKINQLLTTKFYLNSRETVNIMKIEKKLLKSINKSDFVSRQTSSNKKIQSILGSNYQVYQTKKFDFINKL